MIDDVADLSRRKQYTATAGQVEFPYTFKVFDAADLTVYVNGSVLAATGYTVTGVGNDTGGSVVLGGAVTVGTIVTIVGDADYSRLSDYQQNGPWTSARINDEFDKHMAIEQEQRMLLRRSLRAPVYEAEVAELPTAALRASRYLYFDSNGVPTPVTGDPSQPITHTSESYYPTAGQTVIPVSAGYTPGSNNLSVYINGLRKLSSVHYEETSANSITLAAPAVGTEVIEFAIGEVFTVGLAVAAKSKQYIAGADGQTVLTTDRTYLPGYDEIEVYVNGALFTSGVHYTETNATTVTLLSALADGDDVQIIYGQAYNPSSVDWSLVNPRTAAEIAAGVTPTYYQYPAGNPLRYGNFSNGNNTTILQTALNVARYSKGLVFIPHMGVSGTCTWITDTLYVYSGTTVECAPGVVVERRTGAAAGSYIFNCTSYALGTSTLLTANVKRSRRTVAVASAGSLAAGMTVVIREATYVDSGTGAGRWQEINEVESISGLNVTLKNGLMLDYLTANSAEILPFTTENRDVVFRNVYGVVPAGVAGGVYKLNHAYRYRFEHSGGAGMDDVPGLLCYYGTSCRVLGGVWRDGQNTAVGGHGHAISWHEGSVDCHASWVSSSNVREHLFAYGAAFCSFTHCFDVGAATATWNSHGEGCHDCWIEDNVSIGAKQYGISIGGATSFPDYRIYVRRNKVFGAGTHGIVAQGLTGGVFVPYDCVIEDNEVEEYGLDGTASRQGISLEYTRRFRVKGNRIKTAQTNCRAGIYSYGGEEDVIEDNYINGVPSGWAIIYDNATDLKIRNNTGINLASGNQLVKWDGALSPGKVLIEGNQADNDQAYGTLSTGAVQRNNQWKTKAGNAKGATSVADGGTITHGLVGAPTSIRVTGSVSGEFVSVTGSPTSTTFTVAIKTHANGAGTTQTVYWEAEV